MSNGVQCQCQCRCQSDRKIWIGTNALVTKQSKLGSATDVSLAIVSADVNSSQWYPPQPMLANVSKGSQ